MDEVKKKHHWHILTKYNMTCKEHCHTTDTMMFTALFESCLSK